MPLISKKYASKIIKENGQKEITPFCGAGLPVVQLCKISFLDSGPKTLSVLISVSLSICSFEMTLSLLCFWPKVSFQRDINIKKKKKKIIFHFIFSLFFWRKRLVITLEEHYRCILSRMWWRIQRFSLCNLNLDLLYMPWVAFNY